MTSLERTTQRRIPQRCYIKRLDRNQIDIKCPFSISIHNIYTDVLFHVIFHEMFFLSFLCLDEILTGLKWTMINNNCRILCTSIRLLLESNNLIFNQRISNNLTLDWSTKSYHLFFSTFQFIRWWKLISISFFHWIYIM